MHITLRAGEKLYLNGAVIRVDRKVCLELMNDAVFLLEAHVMHVEQATTPLRQLYFIVQTMLMSPHDKSGAQALFDDTMPRMVKSYDQLAALEGLAQTARYVGAGRYYDALKVLRAAFGLDDALMVSAADQLALAS